MKDHPKPDPEIKSYDQIPIDKDGQCILQQINNYGESGRNHEDSEYLKTTDGHYFCYYGGNYLKDGEQRFEIPPAIWYGILNHGMLTHKNWTRIRDREQKVGRDYIRNGIKRLLELN